MNAGQRSPGLGLASARILLLQATRQRIAATEVLHGTGLSLSLLEQGSADVSTRQELQMIDNFCRASGEEPLACGFATGLEYQLSSLGVLGLGILTSRDLRAAMLLIERYLTSAVNLTRLKFMVERNDVRLLMGCAEPVSVAQERFIIGRELGIVGALHQEVLPQIPPGVREIHLAFPRLPAMEHISRFFNCPVQENSAQHCFVGDASYLTISMPMANPLAAEACELACTGQSRPPSENVIDRVRRLVTAELPQVPDMETIAGQLCMSSRTLSRHLEKEGWRWRDLVSECRLSLAEQLLRQGESIKLAAARAGFSSASSFSHAFNRSRGVPPGSYLRSGIVRSSDF
ncbi:AraC family transcriptional regulator ligand-binding domain-containing protein [Thalassolituus sp. LLYu03]|uniref:AraC family transcriptional regulator ligand-binding domain-containing protein n=1 Tax=Thalassolituus sp. LLYu03 TaxID=3421656 RepID=UPI003D274128